MRVSGLHQPYAYAMAEQNGLHFSDWKPSLASNKNKPISERLSGIGGKPGQKKRPSCEHDSRRKKSKHAPAEMSSKASDFFRRSSSLNERGIGVTVGEKGYKSRDPRMLQEMSGVPESHVKYAFLREMRDKEIIQLRKRITAWKMTGKQGKKRRRELLGDRRQSSLHNDEKTLNLLLQEKVAYERQQIAAAAKQAVKRSLLQQRGTGASSGSFRPKRRMLKRMELEAKFDEIKKRGGDTAVNRVIERRRKKNKSKDAVLFSESTP